MIAEPNPFERSPRQRLFGVYSALCKSVKDPDAQGRVQVELPWVGSEDGGRAQAWARLATWMAGKDRGSWFIPDENDEVLVAFAGGDARRPVVIGALWNGADNPPETMDNSGENNLRSFTSRSGHHLLFDDTRGAEKVELETQGGHVLTLDDGQNKIELRHSGGAHIEISSDGSITVHALNQVTVNAPGGMQVTSPMVTVDAPLSKFSGIVKASAVITDAVVSKTYTPGAGNVW